MKYLILGCGPAGIAAAKAIRAKDPKGEIVIATEEKSPPYVRPLLTEVIAGRMERTAISDPQAADLAEKGIEVRSGMRAESIDSPGNRVIFPDGTGLPYDSLLVATGGKPGIPDALSKGTIEACVIPWEVVPAVKVHELTKFHSEFDNTGGAL